MTRKEDCTLLGFTKLSDYASVTQGVCDRNVMCYKIVSSCVVLLAMAGHDVLAQR